ncbi:tail assembly chaperone [Sporosarcina sp. ACRSL]|uniref:tail assembly chaperone n=1 Tax=Sporosarcina sp. ACRSL TaxID=2918215 RepID=UPI001EF4BA04|nr:tail assembly chaperone [Sporosarcina sp. ACRSL]MCG7345307.1 tail assembly chaperone [Sporosarcina sp. ACRSL]
MATFTIGEKEHELKLTYAGVKKLNAIHEGGSFELIGKAMMGDLDTFPHIIQAALLHTGENYTFAQIERAIDEAIEGERLDMNDILRLSNEVITQSFFYKATVTKLMSKDKKAKAALDELLK